MMTVMRSAVCGGGVVFGAEDGTGKDHRSRRDKECDCEYAEGNQSPSGGKQSWLDGFQGGTPIVRLRQMYLCREERAQRRRVMLSFMPIPDRSY
jgi:hypothetical protein